MPKNVRPAVAHNRPSSFLSLLTGWVQQGVESFFATQRILVDVAMRQNAMAMKSLREGVSDAQHSSVAILTDLAVEGTSTFIEAQRILLSLVQQENELLLNGVKERVGSAPAVAATDFLRRSIDNFIAMQQDFLKITSKQTVGWLESVKAGKAAQGTHLVDLAREGMETFVHAQKKFLDLIAQEATKATSGKPELAGKKAHKTELAKLAREATNSLVDAQKKLLDVVGHQMNVNLKAATHTMELLSPARLLPMANITGEGVKSFVSAEKNLIESMIKPRGPRVVKTAKRHPRRAEHAVA